MSKVYALADLHLSSSGEKPMDVFGEIWLNHADRMAAAWDRLVDDADTVLLPGDLSWAPTLEEAAPDLEWIASRPGDKIILRGNHDYWWASLAKVRKASPDRIEPLQNNAHAMAGMAVVVGSRGWNWPGDPVAVPGDDRIFKREMERLKLSIADADRRFGRELPRIAMMHFPPLLAGREPSDMVGILAGGGVSVCVYGHLHGEDHRLAFNGEREGIRFVNVAADAVDFTPVEVFS